MKLLGPAIIILFLTSCGGDSKKEETTTSTSDSTIVKDSIVTVVNTPDKPYEVVNTQGYYVWEVDIEKKTLKKNPAIATAANADSVINGLNRQYEGILLEKVNIKKDTINLKISDSDYLTNQIGSSGADQYIAQAVINLTSVPGIKFVHIDFKGGSHAAPDTWSRKDFPGYIIIQ